MRTPRQALRPLHPPVINLNGFSLRVVQAAAAQTNEVSIALNALLQGMGLENVPYRLVVTGAKLVYQRPDEEATEGDPLPPPPGPESEPVKEEPKTTVRRTKVVPLVRRRAPRRR